MFLRKACTFIRNGISGGNDVSYQTCKFECDSSADLPAQNQTDYMIDIGSEAHDIYNNALYMMDSSGTWQLQQAGTAAYTKSETDALLADKITAPEAIETVFGLGEIIPDGTTDFDAYTTPGVYYSTNVIWPASDATRLEVKYINGTDRILQILYPLNSNGFYFTRVYYSGTWQAWRRVTPFGVVGTLIANGENILDTSRPIGRYYKSSDVNTLSGLPSGFSSAFFMDVVNTVGSNRKKITLHPATASLSGSFYTNLETGSGFGTWYRFDGTAV